MNISNKLNIIFSSISHKSTCLFWLKWIANIFLVQAGSSAISQISRKIPLLLYSIYWRGTWSGPPKWLPYNRFSAGGPFFLVKSIKKDLSTHLSLDYFEISCKEMIITYSQNWNIICLRKYIQTSMQKKINYFLQMSKHDCIPTGLNSEKITI